MTNCNAFPSGAHSLLDDTVRKQLQQRANTLTPAKREGFEQGAELALSIMAEVGVDAAIGQQSRDLISRLKVAKSGAEQSFHKLSGLTPCTDALDERAAQIVNLTASLFRAFIENAKSGCSGQYGDKGLGPSEVKEITRAVSYIVWAYQTSAPMPSVED